MDQDTLMKQVVAQVLQSMGGNAPTAASSDASCEHVTKEQYPLGEKIPERLKTPTGKKLSELKYDDVISGKVGFKDLGITPETLELQAQVAARPSPATCAAPASSSLSPTSVCSRCTTPCAPTAQPSRSCWTSPTSSRMSTTLLSAPSYSETQPTSMRSATALRRTRVCAPSGVPI